MNQRIKELLCGWRRQHDFEMKKATVIRVEGDEMNDWDAKHTYLLTCINCGATYLGYIPEPFDEKWWREMRNQK
jgi:hypothetical protein